MLTFVSNYKLTGWWSQGWHLPHLMRNPNAKIVAIVDAADHPKSNLNPDLEPLSALKEKYGCPTFSSVQELFEKNAEVAASVDGVVVCTPHATHSDIGRYLLEQAKSRPKPLHILMEKPMTTNVEQAKQLHETALQSSSSVFLVNHSANYIPQSRAARALLEAGKIGEVQHITGFMASPLSWIFEDPSNKVGFGIAVCILEVEPNSSADSTYPFRVGTNPHLVLCLEMDSVGANVPIY